MRPGRRRFMGCGLAGAATLSSPFAKAGESAAADKANLHRFIKMRGSLDDRVVIGCVSGQYNGLVEGKTTPLFGVVSSVFSRYKPQLGGYRIVEFEEAYYTDLHTGKVLSHWKNPYTNEIVVVPAYDGTTDRVRVSEDLRFHTDASPPANVRVEHFADGPEINGGDIVFVERVSVTMGPEAGNPAFQYSDSTSLRTPLSDVAEPTIKMAGSKTHFEATCSWRPWLNMGDRPGNMTAVGDGRFGVKISDLSSVWLEHTSIYKPELLGHLELILK